MGCKILVTLHGRLRFGFGKARHSAVTLFALFRAVSALGAINLTLSACSSGSNIGGGSAGQASQADHAVLLASSTVAISGSGGSIALPAITLQNLTLAQGVAIFPTGPAESTSMITANGLAAAANQSFSPSPPSGRCNIVVSESFTFSSAGRYASFPAFSLQIPALVVGTYTLQGFDTVQGPLLESEDIVISAPSSGPGNTLSFPAHPGMWMITAGHTYLFEVFSPLPGHCTGIYA